MPEIIGYDPSIKRTCTCKKCTAIISYTPGETVNKIVMYSSMGNRSGDFITCPNCNTEIRVFLEAL